MFAFSCIEVSGKDAVTFLQGQLTADIKMLSQTQSMLAAHASREGRIQSLYLLTWQNESVHLWLPTSLKATALPLLKKYALFSKVSFNERTDLFLDLVSKLAINIPERQGMLFSSQIEHNDLYIRLPHVNHHLIKISNMPSQPTESNLMDWIDAEIPWILPETSDLFFAHDLHLPQLNAVSFKKGCYLGQEIIARMEYRGKLKRQLKRVELPITDWKLGGVLQIDENTSGKVVLAYETNEKLIALVVG